MDSRGTSFLGQGKFYSELETIKRNDTNRGTKVGSTSSMAGVRSPPQNRPSGRSQEEINFPPAGRF